MLKIKSDKKEIKIRELNEKIKETKKLKSMIEKEKKNLEKYAYRKYH